MMTSQQFAQSIKQKYPQYSSLSDEDLTSKVIAKYPQYKDQINDAGGTGMQGATDAAFNNPVGAAANFLAPAVKSNADAVTNQMDYQTTLPDGKGNFGQSLSNAAASTGHLAEQLPGAALGDAMTILGGKGIKQVVTHPIQTAQAITSPIVTGAKILTKTGAANMTTNAAKTATAAGKTAKWNDIASEVRAAVQSQYGNSVEHMKAADKLLAQEAPAKLGKNITKTPTELLDLRRQILARSGTGNIISKLMGMKNTEDQVAGVARNVISQHVHELAPESKMADKAYSLWSKAKGSPAEWVGRSLVGATAGKVGKILGIPESATGDAIISLLSGTII